LIAEKTAALLINDVRAGNEVKRREATTLSVIGATNGVRHRLPVVRGFQPPSREAGLVIPFSVPN
jgi:hypothetical protein